MFLFVICTGFKAGDFHIQIFQLFLVLIANQVVATFHLHCLGHRIKYGHPEVGNSKQQILQQHDHAAVLSLLNPFYFESFSSHII